MEINKDLLPIKGHFYLYNAGTAALVPYLSTYARQLGFSSATVGVIYTILPIFGLIAKPLLGVIADRFIIQKTLLIIFQAVTMFSLGAIYFIPHQGNTDVSVVLDCAGSSTMIKSCFSSTELVDKCKVASLSVDASWTLCDMNCNMNSPVMWQTVCEHWHLPSYCYSATDSLVYRTNITNIQMIDNCAYFFAESVLLNGLLYTPKCHFGKGYVDVNEPCSLNCNNQNLSAAIGTLEANMTCLNENLNFRVCPNDTQLFRNLSKEPERTECEVTCQLNVNEPWRLMEICEGWGADAAAECAPRTADGLNNFPSNMSFIGMLDLSLTLAEHECVYWHLHDIYFLGVSGPHVPYCVTKAQYQTTSNLFHTSCTIRCGKGLVNEIIQEASESRVTHQYAEQFWLFFICMIISWIGMAVVVSIADAMCFNVLGDNPSHYGKQRLWGSVGWGIFPLFTGMLIDVESDGAVKNYSVAFILMFVCMIGDIVVSCFLRNESNTLSFNILADVSKLMYSPPAIVFFLWTVGVGLCTGLLLQFLFWHLEDIARVSCDSTDYIKTLQGLVSAIQTFFGEIPLIFLSGFLLKKIDHINMMSLVLFAFGVRFISYSFLTNPWWVLPIEMFQGITFGMFYPTMASYANVVSPPGTATTIQGLTGAIFEGVGTSLGSLIGGLLYGKYGGWITFRCFGIGSLVFGVLHVVAQKIIKQKGYDGPVDGNSEINLSILS